MNKQILSTSLVLVLFLSACALPGGGSLDPYACLQGTWEMSNADLNLMLATLVPVPGMSIPAGVFQITFEGDRFVYFSDGFTLRIEMSDGYMETDAGFETGGGYSATDGDLAFFDIVSSRDISTWRAVVNGETVEVPGTTEISFPAPGNGPYSCSANLLAITSASTLDEPFSMVFSR